MYTEPLEERRTRRQTIEALEDRFADQNLAAGYGIN
jgi:hypothetical protein